MELAKEGSLFAQGFLEAKIRDLQRGRVDLPVIVALDFVMQNGTSLPNVRDVVSDAGPDESVLKPLVRALDLAFAKAVEDGSAEDKEEQRDGEEARTQAKTEAGQEPSQRPLPARPHGEFVNLALWQTTVGRLVHHPLDGGVAAPGCGGGRSS